MLCETNTSIHIDVHFATLSFHYFYIKSFNYFCNSYKLIFFLAKKCLYWDEEPHIAYTYTERLSAKQSGAGPHKSLEASPLLEGGGFLSLGRVFLPQFSVGHFEERQDG